MATQILEFHYKGQDHWIWVEGYRRAGTRPMVLFMLTIKGQPRSTATGSYECLTKLLEIYFGNWNTEAVMDAIWPGKETRA